MSELVKPELSKKMSVFKVSEYRIIFFQMDFKQRNTIPLEGGINLTGHKTTSPLFSNGWNFQVGDVVEIDRSLNPSAALLP